MTTNNKQVSKRSQNICKLSLLLTSFTTYLCFHAHTYTLPQTLVYVRPWPQSQMNLPIMRSRQAVAVEADSHHCTLLIISPPLFISSPPLADSFSVFTAN